MIEKAYRIADEAHKEQKRKSGEPISSSLCVAIILADLEMDKETIAAGLLHDVVEDSDGDLWFVTSNGISFYQTDTKEWRSFFSSFDPVPNDENHIFLALCEVSPGVMWAGGYTSGIYKIEKKKGFKVLIFSCCMQEYVRSIYL